MALTIRPYSTLVIPALNNTPLNGNTRNPMIVVVGVKTDTATQLTVIDETDNVTILSSINFDPSIVTGISFDMPSNASIGEHTIRIQTSSGDVQRFKVLVCSLAGTINFVDLNNNPLLLNYVIIDTNNTAYIASLWNLSAPQSPLYLQGDSQIPVPSCPNHNFIIEASKKINDNSMYFKMFTPTPNMNVVFTPISESFIKITFDIGVLNSALINILNFISQGFGAILSVFGITDKPAFATWLVNNIAQFEGAPPVYAWSLNGTQLTITYHITPKMVGFVQIVVIIFVLAVLAIAIGTAIAIINLSETDKISAQTDLVNAQKNLVTEQSNALNQINNSNLDATTKSRLAELLAGVYQQQANTLQANAQTVPALGFDINQIVQLVSIMLIFFIITTIFSSLKR